MDSSSIKKNILKTRKDLGLTQKEMADKLGISRTAYRNLEKGETKVYSSHISAMARLSGKNEEELVLGYIPRASEEQHLREMDNLAERMKTMQEQYEARIQDLLAKLAEKDDLIEFLKSNIRSQQSMLDYLSK
ncbi:MAG: helix-turn-helix transcriptional regulator [Bacteroidales bacterium]|nr:helix-turn-helix transcriptional regulator [Candidatus Cryptobacteroides fimicaballi]